MHLARMAFARVKRPVLQDALLGPSFPDLGSVANAVTLTTKTIPPLETCSFRNKNYNSNSSWCYEVSRYHRHPFLCLW